MYETALPLLSAALASGVAWLLVRHGLRWGLADLPNARSSHQHPIARGGGLAFVLPGLACGCLLAGRDTLGLDVVLSLSVPLAVAGLWDDLSRAPVLPRLLAQLGVVGALLVYLPPPVAWLAWAGEASVMSHVLCAVLWLSGVWWINLFNFMDGADGLAASQSVFMLLAGLALMLVSGPATVLTQPVVLFLLCVVAAMVGFLRFNWPPARLFMGDVGSLWLAFIVLGLAWITMREGWLGLPTWLILAALFVTDASITLLTRLLQGKAPYVPHRTHAYQRLVQRLPGLRPDRHRFVAVAVNRVNLVWILPLATLAEMMQPLGWALVLPAYAPIVWLVFRIRAGRAALAPGPVHTALP